MTGSRIACGGAGTWERGARRRGWRCLLGAWWASGRGEWGRVRLGEREGPERRAWWAGCWGTFAVTFGRRPSGRRRSRCGAARRRAAGRRARRGGREGEGEGSGANARAITSRQLEELTTTAASVRAPAIHSLLCHEFADPKRLIPYYRDVLPTRREPETGRDLEAPCPARLSLEPTRRHPAKWRRRADEFEEANVEFSGAIAGAT